LRVGTITLARREGACSGFVDRVDGVGLKLTRRTVVGASGTVQSAESPFAERKALLLVEDRAAQGARRKAGRDESERGSCSVAGRHSPAEDHSQRSSPNVRLAPLHCFESLGSQCPTLSLGELSLQEGSLIGTQIRVRGGFLQQGYASPE
jgi:hypothetical protein